MTVHSDRGLRMTTHGGDRYNAHGGGDASGRSANGHEHTATMRRPDVVVDVPRLLGFATAIEQSLPVLPMDPRLRQQAQGLATDIQQEAGKPAPDHRVLKAYGQELRNIVGSTGSTAL